MEGTPNRRCQLENEAAIQKHGKYSARAHGQESMNFFQGEYDAGASLASHTERRHINV
jgi:hypothetical protein